jgi:predicted DCC family thiol-disulfide oxidoreductase YuxK
MNSPSRVKAARRRHCWTGILHNRHLPLPNSNHHIVLFDGECGLCSAAVQYLLRADRRGLLRFAELQGETGRATLARHGFSAGGSAGGSVGDSGEGRAAAPDSLGLILDFGTARERLLFESVAVLHIARRLGGWRGALGALGSLVPRVPADRLYRAIALRRHRLSRAAAACRLPDVDTDQRFLP